MHDILFLAHRPPYPPDKGDRIRSWNLASYLGARGRLSIACTADAPPEAEVLDRLAEISERRLLVPLGRRRWLRALAGLAGGRSATEGLFASPRIGRRIRRWHRERPFTAAVVFCSGVFPYVRELPAELPVVFDCVDVDSEKFVQYAEAAGAAKRMLYGLEARRLRALERRAAGRSRVVTLVSAEEAELFRRLHGADNVLAVPNGVSLDYFRPPTGDPVPCSCVFVGMMDYPPNVAAVEWFADRVFARLLRSHPRATFRIVGRRPARSVRALGSRPGIEVTGGVEDVRPHLAEATVAIAPLRIARGIQNKVLEAMSMARPVVASPAALAGLEASPGRELLTAESPEEWLEAVSSLFDDASRCRALGREARAYVERHHRWERCLAPLGAVLEDLAAPE